MNQIAAAASGDALFVFVLVGAQLYTNWTDGPPGSDSWQRPWVKIPPPTWSSTLQVLTAVCSDPQYIDVQVTDSTGQISGFRWTETTPWSPPNAEWFHVNGPGQPSGSVTGTVIAESSDVYDFVYTAPAPILSAQAPVLVSRVDQTGAALVTGTVSLGGGAYFVAPIAVVQRGQDRVEAYVAAPGTPGTSIWTRANDDPAVGPWSPWAPISNDGGDISTLQQPWSVAAVSQLPQRTDLFVALYGGTTGSQGGIYTTYFQDVDFSAAPPDPPPFPVPAGSPPLDIPAQLSGTDLQQRAQAIMAVFGANQVPAFPALRSTMAYLEEAYYFVPVYLANQLVAAGPVHRRARLVLHRLRLHRPRAAPRHLLRPGPQAKACPRRCIPCPPAGCSDPLNPHAIAQPGATPTPGTRCCRSCSACSAEPTRCSPPTPPNPTRRPGPCT